MGHGPGSWLRAAGLLLSLMLACVSTVLYAQTCGVPGRQGFVAVAGTAVNSYFAGSGSPAAGATSITLASGTNANRGASTTLLAGDLVLIIQMQDSSGSLEGNYEYAVVAVGGGAGATIQLTAGLANSYAQSVGAGTVRTYQVVRVPQYSAATLSGTINVLPWYIEPTTGSGTGGIFAVDVAGALTLSSVTINANGRGFRGGLGNNSTTARAGGTPFDADYSCDAGTQNGGFKGEGTEGSPQRVFGFNAAGTAGTTFTFDLAGQVFSGGQGYPSGSCGQSAKGNAGGGANDGDPPNQSNGYNSGGGGAANAGAGGIGGNSWNGGDNTTTSGNNPTSAANSGLGGFDAGGRGGNAQSIGVATKIYMGGGGGAGGANNASANVITTFPPTSTSTVANGASGAVTSSGAPGGGIVLLRAGSIAVTASTINAQGVAAYNKAVPADTDAGGGGGAGGTVIIDAGSGSASGLTVNASGGNGGSSNYYNHGPGGGGGGGYVAANVTGATVNVGGGQPGTDACCSSMMTGNLSPKNYRAAAGGAGSSTSFSGATVPPGAGAGSDCLPNLTITKTTSTPLVSSTASTATASWTINVANAGGAATNVFLLDPGFPLNWTYKSSAPVATYQYSPSPGAGGAIANAAGAETTSATGVASVPVLPVATLVTSNSVTAVSLRSTATVPGITPTTAAGSATFGSFFIPQGGSISVTFAVSIPTTATVGTYHNAAGVVYLDPTRNAAAARLVSPSANVSANRLNVAYSGNTSFQSGGTTTVPGSNYNGQVAGPSGEDVQLVADFSVTKGAPVTATVGGTYLYTITPRNNGRALATYTFAATGATDVANAAAIGTQLGSSPLSLTDTLPTGLRMTTTFAGNSWACVGTTTAVCTLADAIAYPRAAATNFPTLTGVVSPTCAGSGVKVNTVTISQAQDAVVTSNNVATTVTTVSPACGTASLSVTKDNATTTLPTGATTFYTVTVANAGPSAATGTVLVDPAVTGLSCTTVSCSVASGAAICPAVSIAALQGTGITIATLPASSSLAFVVGCKVTATGL